MSNTKNKSMKVEQKKLMADLAKPFQREVNGKKFNCHKWLPKTVAGKKIMCVPYLSGKQVSERLNEVLGIYWNFEIREQQDGSKIGSLSVSFDEGETWMVRQDIGTESREEKEKGSVTDALKRCASLFGVGAYLNKIDNYFISWAMSKKNKETPCDNKGRLLYGDNLNNYINGFSGPQGFVVSMVQNYPDTWDIEETQNLYKKLKNY